MKTRETTEAERLWTIGEVVAYLKPRFPGVTVSKIRFWEEQGLLRPRRTTGGHRLYCPADVERLALILHLRLRRHLPLRVVRAIVRRMEVDPQAEPTLMELFWQTAEANAWEARPIEDVRRELGWTAEDIEQAARLGFVFPCAETGRLEPEDIVILRLLDEVRRMTGVTLADLRPYVQAARRLARWETRLLRRAQQHAQAMGEKPDDLPRRLRETLQSLLRALYLRHVQKGLLDRWTGRSGETVSGAGSRPGPGTRDRRP
ncbi:putative HTH-type transcriptional regulator [bacterium HR11]|nr:putative HTH-type transcriptional regulator [bacterium HR11]